MTRSSVVPAAFPLPVEPHTSRFWNYLLSFRASTFYPPRTALFTQAEAAHSLFFLRKGIVKLTSTAVSGRKQVLDICFSGSPVSSSALLGQSQAYPFSSETITDCHIISLNPSAFSHFLQQNTEFSYAFHQLQAAQAEQHLQTLEQIKTQDVPERYIRLLRQFAAELGTRTIEEGTWRVVLPLEDTEIASYLAISPEYFCKLQKRMQEQGLLRRKGRSVLLLSTTAFR